MFTDILSTILFAVLSILIMFLLCKGNGPRQMSQLTMFDYINSITLGSIGAELATDLENWTRPFTAMLTYGLITIMINRMKCKSVRLRNLLCGKPLLLMENGVIFHDSLARAHLDLSELLTQCRTNAYFDLSQLKAIILEPNGQLSFLARSINRPLTANDLGLSVPKETLWYTLIMDGNILPDNLKSCGKEEKWLLKQLKTKGIASIKDTFWAGCDENNTFWACSSTAKAPEKHCF